MRYTSRFDNMANLFGAKKRRERNQTNPLVLCRDIPDQPSRFIIKQQPQARYLRFPQPLRSLIHSRKKLKRRHFALIRLN
jgi:hypothetical protein